MNFWESRWIHGQTGWHNSDVNEHLKAHQRVLFQEDSPKIFVPLCGKSLDMMWLSQQGASIVGVDLVKNPLDQYFEEHCLTPNSQITQGIEGLSSGNQTLFHANIFDVTLDVIEPVDAIYDRAALVALSPELREAYVEHCFSLLKPGGTILLITYDSPVADDHGPPFPVRKGTVEKLFASAEECVQIDEVHTTKKDSERLQKRNLDWSRSDIWKIIK